MLRVRRSSLAVLGVTLALLLTACGAGLAPNPWRPTRAAGGAVMHLQLVSDAMPGGMGLARLTFELPDGPVTRITRHDGRLSLRLPAGTWSVTVAADAACAAPRRFTLAVPPGESTELLAIDAGPDSCPPPPAADEASPGVVISTTSMTSSVYSIGAATLTPPRAAGLARRDLRRLPLRSAADL